MIASLSKTRKASYTLRPLPHTAVGFDQYVQVVNKLLGTMVLMRSNRPVCLLALYALQQSKCLSDYRLNVSLNKQQHSRTKKPFLLKIRVRLFCILNAFPLKTAIAFTTSQ